MMMRIKLILIAVLLQSPIITLVYASELSIKHIISTLNPLDDMGDIEGIHHSISLNIQFDFASSDLLSEGKKQLHLLGQALNSRRLSGYGFLLVGHTDAEGNDRVNLQLSNARAEEVALYLIDHVGVSEFRLETEGRGESELLANLALNDKRHRRVEVIAIKLEDYIKSYSPETGYIIKDLKTDTVKANQRNKVIHLQ